MLAARWIESLESMCPSGSLSSAGSSTMKYATRSGSLTRFSVVLCAATGLLVLLGFLLWRLGQPGSPTAKGNTRLASETADGPSQPTRRSQGLLMYCAAGIRTPVEQIAAAYEREFGVPIQLQYGGSNTLLSQITVAKTGDLYLSADESYIELGIEKGVVREAIPLAVMRPVIAVRKGNPRQISGLQDLLRDDIKTALGNPDQAAIGKTTRRLLEASGDWSRLEAHVTRTGVFKPTVPEVANDVKLGSVDAGIVWDTTLGLYPDLEAVHVPEFEAGKGFVTVGVLAASEAPTDALRFALSGGARQGARYFSRALVRDGRRRYVGRGP